MRHERNGGAPGPRDFTRIELRGNESDTSRRAQEFLALNKATLL
jgi:hypothetical protein